VLRFQMTLKTKPSLLSTEKMVAAKRPTSRLFALDLNCLHLGGDAPLRNYASRRSRGNRNGSGALRRDETEQRR
jgi:hypothetical protein